MKNIPTAISTITLAGILLTAAAVGGGPDGAQKPTPPPKRQSSIREIYTPPPIPTMPVPVQVGSLLTQKFTGAPFRIRLKLASRALDEWTKRFEEYGSVTMSSPLISRENGDFAFDVKDGAEEFYANAKTRTDGTAAATLAIMNKLSVSGEATIDPLAKAQFNTSLANYNSSQQTYNAQLRGNNAAIQAQQQAAKIKLEADLAKAADPANAATAADMRAKAYTDYAASTKAAGPLTEPTFPDPNLPAGGGTLSGGATTPAGSPAAQAAANLPALSTDEMGFLNLIGGIQPGTTPASITAPTTVSDRLALIEAAGNTSVKAIFKLLGQPNKTIGFDDKKVLFATVTVGVNPGWRTRKDFSAEITSQASYRYVKARTDVVTNLYKRIPQEVRVQVLENHRLTETVKKMEADEAATAPAVVQRKKQEYEEAKQDMEQKVQERNAAAQVKAAARQSFLKALDDNETHLKNLRVPVEKMKGLYQEHLNLLQQRAVQAPAVVPPVPLADLGLEATKKADAARLKVEQKLQIVQKLREALMRGDAELDARPLQADVNKLPDADALPLIAGQHPLLEPIKKLNAAEAAAVLAADTIKAAKREHAASVTAV